MISRSIVVYYILIVIPLTILLSFLHAGIVNSFAFAAGLFGYSFIYHPLVSGIRLVRNKKIPRRWLWRNFIPGWNWKYYKFLFLDYQE